MQAKQRSRLPVTRIRLDALQTCRAEAGLTTLRELGDQVGVDESTVSRLITGDMKPGANTIGALMRTFAPRGSGRDFWDLFEVVDPTAERLAGEAA
jgi:transcriptional regulator with XRE-family HTH domain